VSYCQCESGEAAVGPCAREGAKAVLVKLLRRSARARAYRRVRIKQEAIVYVAIVAVRSGSQ
jgi:hypothetical protein